MHRKTPTAQPELGAQGMPAEKEACSDVVLDLAAPTYSKITVPKPPGNMKGSPNRDATSSDPGIPSQSSESGEKDFRTKSIP